MSKVSFIILFFLMILLALPFIPNFVFGGIINSTYDFFNATNLTRFNWTNSVIFIGSYNNTTTVSVNNKTTDLNPDYSQHSGVEGDYPTTKWEICFPGITTDYNVSFEIKRGDGTYTNFTHSLNESEVENFTLSIHPFCPPGRYSGNILLTRVGNSSDNINLSATVDIPISVNNTLDMNYNRANFSGAISINHSYHSYYFNTGGIAENITGLTIKLTNLNDDIDVFVFNSSGVLKGKSTEKSTSDEEIIDLDLPTQPDMWEIRVYGNVSSSKSYKGFLYFSTLNITNTSSPNEAVNSLYFGDLDPNSTDNKTYNLTNEDNRNLTDVYEYFEIYHIDSWGTENTSKEFLDFLVPSFATKIKVMINWTVESGKDTTNWNLYLRDSSGNLIGSSTDKFVSTNKTNATREEFVVFTGPFNSSNEGFWNITVENATNSTIPLSYYNIITYVWMNESNWIASDYTDGFDFSSADSTNDSFEVGLNLTIPETQVLDGRFEAIVKYNSSEGWKSKLPISFNVSAGTLIVNNSLNDTTITLKDNIGFNRLGATALTLNVTFNNTGSHPIYYALDTSNYTLTKNGNNISFSVENQPSSPINAGTSGTIDIAFSINTTNTSNSPEIYRGWIFLNTTNTTLNSSSYPYKTFNLSLEFNLTDELVIQLVSVNTSNKNQTIETPFAKENVTFVTKVYLANGTQLQDPALHEGNFTSPRFTETNYTSKYYDLTNVTQERASGLCYGTPTKCYVNATTPTAMIGGRYRASIKVGWNTSESMLNGTGSYDGIVVNDTGFYMDTSSNNTASTITMNNGTTRIIYVNVTNYGPLSAQTSLNYSEYDTNCPGYTVSATSGTSNCPSPSAAGSTWTFKPAAYSSCLSWWVVSVPATQNTTSSCDSTIVNGSGMWFNPNGITISISTQVTPTTTTTTTTTSAGDGAEGEGEGEGEEEGEGESIYLKIDTYPSTVSIEQGKNKTESVKVKNLNDTEWQTVTLSVIGIDSSWYDIPINNKELEPEQLYSFYVTFLIPDNATVKDYACQFQASSSFDTVSKDFTLKVTPGPEMQVNINVTLSDYESEISDLEKIINKSRDQGKNTSIAENKFSDLKELFEMALEYRDVGDYKSAYELFDDIDILLNETRTALEEAGIPTGGFLLGDWWNWGKWVIVATVGVVAIFLGYLFWPTSTGYEPEKFVIKTKREVVKDTLSDKYKKLKEKWSKIREEEEQKKQEQAEQQTATTGENQ